MTATKPTGPMASIYNGRTCIGFVICRGPAGFEAFDAEQQSLGLFTTEREAVAATLERRPAP
jgi:hypothetical protein